MAWYNRDTGVMEYEPDRRIEGCSGWWRRDCGCCGGLVWGGNEPIDCGECGGSGFIYFHRPSMVTAEYPGGKFTGRLPKESGWNTVNNR